MLKLHCTAYLRHICDVSSSPANLNILWQTASSMSFFWGYSLQQRKLKISIFQEAASSPSRKNTVLENQLEHNINSAAVIPL